MNSWPNMDCESVSFCGNLDGNGVTIYGLYQKSAGSAALFSNVDAGAVIKNIGLKNSYITSTADNCQVGGFAAATNSIEYGAKKDGVIQFDSCVIANNYMYNSSGALDSTGVVVGRASNDTVHIDNCLVYGNDAAYEAVPKSESQQNTNQQSEWKSHPEDYKLLAFTFDDGPSSKAARLVDLFSLYEGTGTFFVRGISISGDSSYSNMQSAINAGWDIGNHGDKHMNAQFGGAGGGEVTYDQINADITNLTNKLESNLKTRDGSPYRVRFYRPPNIKPTSNTFKVCTEQNLAVIWLERDSMDWSGSYTYNSRYKIFKDGIGTWNDGDVILCHEHGTVGSDDTYNILVELLPEFYEAGYRFCSISELMELRGITQSQVSGELKTNASSKGMVTNILDDARDKVAPIVADANDMSVKNSIIFDTPAFNYAQNEKFDSTDCYQNVLTNVKFEAFLFLNGKEFSPTEEQIKVIKNFADAELPEAFVATQGVPELRSFHDAIVPVGAAGHTLSCSCGLADSNVAPHNFVCDDDKPEWDSYYCEDCGYVCEHIDPEEGTTEYEGDCVTAEGYEFDCPICGYHEESYEEIAGHNFTFNEAEVGEDCQTAGTIAHNHCDVCDKDYAADADEFEPFENALTDLTGEKGACVELVDDEGNLVYGCDKENHWTVCELCGELVETTAHDLNEGPCDICGAVKTIEDVIDIETSGIYTIVPTGAPEDYDMATDVVVYDKLGNVVKYNAVKGGYPLVAGQSYTVVFADELDLAFDAEAKAELAETKLFPDTSASGWYNDAVNYVVGAGIMSGYASNGKFGTSDKIKRQDFIVMLARYAEVDLTEYEDLECTLTDVQDGSYYEAAINWALAEGITTGYNNGKFGVGDKMTREQIVTFLYRYAKDYLELDVTVEEGAEAEIAAQYADFGKVSSFSKEAIVWAVSNGVINGKNETTIAPQGNAQRCEVAQIMYNIFLNEIF